MTTQFQGETAWDAVVADSGLDLEEEAEFRNWLKAHGFDIGDEYHINPDIPLDQLESALAMWEAERE